MDEKWLFRDKFIKFSLLFAGIVFSALMSVMMVYAEHKNVIVTDETGTGLEDIIEPTMEPTLEPVNGENITDNNVIGSKWDVDISKIKTPLQADNNLPGEGLQKDLGHGHIFIPCSVKAKLDEVDVSVRFDTMTATVNWPDTQGAFYHTNLPSGDLLNVTALSGSFDGETVKYVIKTDRMCECVATGTDGGIDIEIVPVNIAETVVLVDAGHGGSMNGTKVGDLIEKNVTLAIAKKVKEITDAYDTPYKVLLTRSSDETINTETRLELVESLGADYYIGIHLESNPDDTKAFGMSAAYNDIYFRNGIQNIDFADAVLKNACSVASDKATGLKPATDAEVILEVIDIPATVLYAGYMSNPDEAGLLASDEYIGKIALGIVKALDKLIK